MSKIEDVAKAIWQHIHDAKDGQVRPYEQGRQEYLLIARAAIKAMRQPTKAMKECGHNAGWHGNIDGDPQPEEDAAEALWQSMIDAALK